MSDCNICGITPQSELNSTPDKYVQTEDELNQESLTQQPYRSIALPQGTIVYILGSIAGGKPVIEVHSSINGWHIRTIPASRFLNPVLVGAGAGVVAVVERTGSYDFIRITDEYGGAGASSYDAWGFPLTTVDFTSIDDFRQIVVPTGYQVTGLKILPNGMLIAGISNGSGTYTYLKALVDTLPTNVDDSIDSGPFEAATPYEGINVLPQPFDLIGNPVGSFSLYDVAGGDRMYQIFTAAQHPVLGGSVLCFDFIRNKVIGHFGLPQGTSVISLTQSGEIVSILVQDSTSTYIIRAQVEQLTYFMAGNTSDKTIPPPSTYPVYHTFTPQDDPYFANIASPTINDLIGYLEFSGFLNKDSAYFGVNTRITASNQVETTSGIHLGSVSYVLNLLLSGGRIDSSNPNTPIVTTPPELPYTPDGPFTKITATDSTTISDGRSGISAVYTTSFGGSSRGNTSYPVIKIASSPVSKSYQPQYIEGTDGVVTEMYAKRLDNKIDISKALFLSLHNDYYDWLSWGGFTYGCTSGTVTTAQTSGIIPISLATDTSGELGQHKDLPDLKVVIYDYKTGLIIYREPKPQGFTVFGGFYADLALPSTISQSSCGISTDSEATLLDGIDRPSDTSPVPSDENNYYPVLATQETSTVDAVPVVAWDITSDPDPWGDYNYPWQMFVRKASSTGVINVTPKLSSWTTKSRQFTDIMPWWRNLTNPCVVTSVLNMFYPPNGTVAAPTLTCSALSGFWFLGLPLDTDTFSIPNAISNTILQVTTSDAQNIDPILGGTVEIPEVIAPADAWNSITIPGDDNTHTRGVVIDPGIRSWVAVELQLNRYNGAENDGQVAWLEPETRAGLLGLNVGSAAISDIIGADPKSILYPYCGGIVPGDVYSTGFEALGGASGAWEYQIYINGALAKTVATPVTYTGQITGMAPTDMQSSLLAAFNAAGSVDPVVGLHFGNVYFTPDIVKTVMVKVQLVNYAVDVIRYGVKTISYVETQDNITGSIPAQPGNIDATILGYKPNVGTTTQVNGKTIDNFSYGKSPDFYTGNDCSALCSGNVTCASFVGEGQGKLCTNDPISASVRNVLAEIVATCNIPDSNDPYLAQGLGVGRYINAYLNFNLNAGLFNYNINLKSGQGQSNSDGNCQ